MKIGFDAKRAFFNTSGLGNYSRNTLNALIKYFPDNQYVLFTPEIKPTVFANYNNFETVQAPENSSKFYKKYWRTFLLSQLAEKNKTDVFHGLSNELPNGIHKTKVASIVTIHDLIFLRHPEFYKFIDRKIYLRKVKYACKKANKIIAISEQTKNDIVEFLKVDNGKIEVIYQSISPVHFERNTDIYLPMRYNLPEKYILVVGTIEPRKNQLSVLKAIQRAHLNLPVVFVGKQTEYINELHNFIQQNKLKNQLIFLQDIPENDLAGIYQLASLSVYISVFEGFGLPVIESMANGCPVITSTLSCLPETAGNAALFCHPEDFKRLGDLITEILDNKKQREILITKGLDRAKYFHPKIYAEKLVSLYSKIL